VSLHYLVKCQTSHSSGRRHLPIAWSTLIELNMWLQRARTWNNSIDYAVWGALQQMVYLFRQRQSASWNRRSSVSGANCRRVWLIPPLVSGIAGLSTSSSSKADTLNIWCKYCKMWQLLWTTDTTSNLNKAHETATALAVPIRRLF